jgi:hypothetical protein
MKLMQRYWAATPKKWRKVGDAILATATFVTGGGLLAFDQIKDVFGETTLKYIIGSCFIIGVAGKFITNLFKSDDAPTQ